MAEGAEVVERDTRIGREPVTLPDLTEQLRLADAVDAQIPLEIGIEFDDLLRIPRLLDDEIDKEAFQLDGRVAADGRSLDNRCRADVPGMAVGSVAVPLVPMRRMAVGGVTIRTVAVGGVAASRHACADMSRAGR